MSGSALSSDHPVPPRFADPAALVRRAAQAFRPTPRIDVAEFAARNRWLANPGGGYTGRWSHDQAPYLIGPMQALTSRQHTTMVVVGPGQSGKTTIAENWVLRDVAIDPANVLWYMQTDRVMRDFVKGEFDRMIEAHPHMRERLGPRPSDNTQEFKRFRGMTINFMVAATNNLISRRAPRIVADEIDAYDPSIGNVIAQLDVRRQTFGDESMLLVISHPDRVRGMREDQWTAGVMQVYRRSTRGLWYWPCPHCNGWSSPNPTATRVMSLNYPEDAPLDEIADAARLLCPICGSLIEDKHRRAMNIAAQEHHGGWIYQGQAIDEDGRVTGTPTANNTGGVWIVGAMSTFTMGGLGGLARSLVEAQRNHAQEGSDETEKDLREVYTKRLGIPYTPPRRVGSVDAATLVERAEVLPLGRVVDGVRFLTGWADVQRDGFRILIRGWGVQGESWVVASIRRKAEPTAAPADWDALIEWALTTGFPLDDGSGRAMKLRGFGYDSGGEAGVTQQAYDAFVRNAMRRKIRMLGMQDGRPVWNVIPTKGMPGGNIQRLAVVRPDTQRSDRMVKISAGTLALAQFAANAFKDDLAGQLGIINPGPWAVHLPAGLKSATPPHAWFEELVSEERRKNGTWADPPAGRRNEALDQMVGTHVVAHLHGLRRISWDRPPAWAGPWDSSPLVVAGDTIPSTPASPAQTEAPAPQPVPTAATATVHVMPKARLFAGFAARMGRH